MSLDEAYNLLGYYSLEYEDIEEARDFLMDKIEELKNKNNDLIERVNLLQKECNEENRRCMLLAVENQDLKEKLREV